MLNLTDLKKGSAGFNMPVMKDSTGHGYGYKMYVGTAAVTGSKTVDLSTIFASIDAVFLGFEEETIASMQTASNMSWSEPSTGQVKIWVYKHTSTSNPTLIPGTSAASVRYMVIGK